MKELRRSVRHRPQGMVVVEGVRLVADLARWDLPIRELYLAADVVDQEWVQAAVFSADDTYVLKPEVLASIAPTRTPQGVLALVDEPRWPMWSGEQGVALWLDGIQEPGNTGAIIRAAAGLGASAVLMGPGSADPFLPTSVRGSAGAVFRIPVECDVSASRAADRVRQNRGSVWAADAGGKSVSSWTPRNPLVLMLGAEGAGLSGESLALADGTVSVALERGIESLNVAVAAGVLLAAVRESRGTRVAPPRREYHD